MPERRVSLASQIAESLSDWPGNSKNEMKAVQQKIKALVESGQLGIFAHGYWGHPAMKLPPEVNLIAVSHYLQALEYQRYANQVVAMLGGKTPHIQNVAVGGVANAINLSSEAALNVDRLYAMKSLLDKVIGQGSLTIQSQTFGILSQTAGDQSNSPRQMQLALKLYF